MIKSYSSLKVVLVLGVYLCVARDKRSIGRSGEDENAVGYTSSFVRLFIIFYIKGKMKLSQETDEQINSFKAIKQAIIHTQNSFVESTSVLIKPFGKMFVFNHG